MAKILIIEDDVMLAQLVGDALESANHIVEQVADGKEGYERLKLYAYDLVIIDRTLPNMDGVDICLKYRAGGGEIPILFLTGKGAISERTEGLDAGADDYLPKPFALPELQSRVRALLRRPVAMKAELLQAGDLSLDVLTGVAKKSGHEIKLLPKELSLLAFFMRNQDVLYSANHILEKVWSSESDATEDAVRQTILRLRKKIDQENSDVSYIQTVKGVGYKFRAV